MSRFIPLPAPTDAEVVALAHKIEHRVLSCLGLSGAYTHYAEQQGDPYFFQSPLLKECYTASIQGRVVLSAKTGAYV